MRSTPPAVGVAVVAAFAAACAAASVATAHPAVVGCAKSVYGPLDGWRNARSTVRAGPVAWPYFGAPRARSSYGPHRGLAVFVKGLLVVEPGRSAIVRVPARERSRLSLYYGTEFNPRANWHGRSWFRVPDGAAAITFKACPRGRAAGWTQFAGGFIVRGPQCAAVEVKARGSARWQRRRISFGAGTCG